MIQHGQRLPLDAEAPQHFTVVDDWIHQLNGHLLAVLVVSAFAQIHRGHTAVSDLLNYFIGPDATTDHAIL